MKYFWSSFRPSLRYLFKDPINIALMVLPILIGIGFYALLGAWIFETLFVEGREWIALQISGDSLGTVLSVLLGALLTFFLFTFINLTLVLVVTLIGCPFYDMIGTRVERKTLGKRPLSVADSFSSTFSKILFLLGNETKKVAIILLLSALAFALGIFPLLTPVGLIISAVLLSIEFVDFSWSRHNLKWRSCVGEVGSNFFPYLLGGGILFFLINIPFINLIVPAWAVSFYSVYWTSQKYEQLPDSE